MECRAFGFGPLLSTALLVASSVGCAATTAGPTQSPGAQSPDTLDPASLKKFSDTEQARIQEAQPHVARAAERYEIDPALINGLIWVESRFEPRAKSPAGARGLMQLMPGTASSLADQMGEASRPYDPDFNVRAGAYYLAKLRDRFDGDERLALAAYNAGPGTVKRWLEEDGALAERGENFVARVEEARARFVHHADRLEAAPTTPSQPKTNSTEPTEPTSDQQIRDEETKAAAPQGEGGKAPVPVREASSPTARSTPVASTTSTTIAQAPPPPEPVFRPAPELDPERPAPPPGWPHGDPKRKVAPQTGKRGDLPDL